MAHMDVEGLGPLIDDLGTLASLPESVIDDMLNAGADVIVEAQRAEIQRQWTGPHSMGISAKAIVKNRKIRSSRTYYGTIERYIDVYPQGERKRGNQSVRNAEIAFINEYGAPQRGIEGRPALGDAVEKKEQEAVEAGEKVYHAYLDSKNL